MLDFDKKVVKAKSNTFQGRVVEFAPGEQSVDRSTLHSVCWKKSFLFFVGKNSTFTGAITFADKIQTSDLCWCVQVRSELRMKRSMTGALFSGHLVPALRRTTGSENWKLW